MVWWVCGLMGYGLLPGWLCLSCRAWAWLVLVDIWWIEMDGDLIVVCMHKGVFGMGLMLGGTGVFDFLAGLQEW